MEGEFWIPSEYLKDAPEIPAQPQAVLSLSHKKEEMAPVRNKETALPGNIMQQTTKISSDDHYTNRGNLFVIDLVRDLRQMRCYDVATSSIVSSDARDCFHIQKSKKIC